MPILVPLSVPEESKKNYCQNFERITCTSTNGRLFLFAGDQKIEHLNRDFYADQLDAECGDPVHLFSIAQAARIGAFASHLGLIARYAGDFRDVPYVIKLNAKTDLVKTDQKEPLSQLLHTVEQVVTLKKNSGLSIVGIGYTIYLGSQYESLMLHQAAQAVWQAHQAGLIAILWIYPRGKAIGNERDADLIAGAAGVAAALGADFVKINPPDGADSPSSAKLLVQATRAAGKTGVICSGGSKIDTQQLLQQVYDQITIGGSRGVALGRNIHQRKLQDALKICTAVGAILFDNQSVTQATAHLL